MTRAAAGRTLAILSLAGAFSVFLLPISNPDVYWHLSAGEWMARRLAVPSSDWLSFTRAGSPWSDFEWGTQLLWLLVYRAAGFAGLWALKAASFCAAGTVLWRLLGLYDASLPAKAAGLFLWSLAVLPANDLRPENASVIFFLAVLFVLEKRRLLRDGAKGAETLAAAVFFAAWANLHAGFLYGLVLLAVYSGAEAFRKKDARFLIPVAAGAAGTLLNPYGASVYRVLWEHFAARNLLENYIREWQEASVTDAWLLPLWILLAAALGAALKRALERRLPPEQAAALSIFALSAAAHVRTGVYFSSLALPFLFSVRSGDERRPGRVVVAGACFAACFGFFIWRLAGPLSEARTLNTRHVPVRLSGFLEREMPVFKGLRMYNPWHWGGYLGWRLGPDLPVFYDGRYIFHELLVQAQAAKESPENFGAFLARHGIELVVLRRTGQMIFERREKAGRAALLSRPIYHAYMPSDKWALVYWDGQGLVFVSRTAASAGWLDEHEYRHFRPEDLPAARLASADPAVLERLETEIRRHYERRGERPDAVVSRWLEALRRP